MKLNLWGALKWTSAKEREQTEAEAYEAALVRARRTTADIANLKPAASADASAPSDTSRGDLKSEQAEAQRAEAAMSVAADIRAIADDYLGKTKVTVRTESRGTRAAKARYRHSAEMPSFVERLVWGNTSHQPLLWLPSLQRSEQIASAFDDEVTSSYDIGDDVTYRDYVKPEGERNEIPSDPQE